MTSQTDIQAPDENRLIAERRAKLDALRQVGPAYPNDFRPDTHAADLHRDCGELDEDALLALGRQARVAGRMMLKRIMGKASFATLQDSSGRLQLYLDRGVLGDEAYAAFKSWDIGDIVGAEGEVFKTRKGELSLRVQSLRLLSKSLRPLPDKFHGVADQELRYRQRYVDLIMTEGTRETFLARSRIVTSIRQIMSEAEFLEVETPMLHPIPGGAAAKPFITHHNALDMDMYLRIAPELYLKRLIVGGFERVFEINRNFRNEGVSPRHNPEFTMMEFYAAYTDYRWLMDYTESLIRETAQRVCGTASLNYQGQPLDLDRAFDRLTIVEAILKYAPGYAPAQLADEAWLRGELRRLGADVNGPALAHAGLGALQLALFEETAEAKLWHPTFIIDYPVEVSPLARASDTQAGITERFELFACGREIANGFSELNDPEDQAARFQAQVAAKDAGDEEAMYYDADYVRALEYGMPPTGGCGIGIDRLVMMLTDSPNIRDVILFPHLRRED
ncbi:lysine--tRNA ligase [Castellaniella sp.]|uniref:lysine--tRNA ligase n=1 Tax=Castellaniella sp. TaxID=1955812 RepID=UPI003C72C21C